MYVVELEEIEEEANPTANLELLQERKKLVLLLCIALCFHKRPDMNKNLDEKPKVGRRLLYTVSAVFLRAHYKKSKNFLA